MELSTVPHRSPHAGERRRLVLALLVLVPVVLLVLLPAGLGLHRYLVTDGSMGGTLGKGSIVLARSVPAGDLRVGDVITFAEPGDTSGRRVTHRVVALRHGEAVTRGDESSRVDPWRLSLDHPSYSRVVLHMPWFGYPFLVPGGWLVMFALLAGAVLSAAWNLHLRGPKPRSPLLVSDHGAPPGALA